MEFYNPNIAGEMAQLLIKNQNKYVPSCGNGESKKIITPIPFHGDQLRSELGMVYGHFRMVTMNLTESKALIPSLLTGMEK